MINAATVPLNGLAAVQILDLLGEPPADANRLLVAGAAGALGGYLLALAGDRGWNVTGLARDRDEALYGVSAPTSPTMLSRGGMR